MIYNIQKYFKAKSLFHLIIIFLIFAISGSLTIYLSTPVLNFFNLNQYIDSSILYFFVRVLLIFPLYQLVLLLVAFVFGELNYFIEFEKKTFKKLLHKK